MDVLSLVVPFMTDNWPLILGITLLAYRVLNRETRNVPPGPQGFPLVGYLPFLSVEAQRDCVELAKKYGSVFSLKLGPNNCVM